MQIARLPEGWFYNNFQDTEIQCFQIKRQFSSQHPMVLTKTLIIKGNLKQQVNVDTHLITRNNAVLHSFPSTLNTEVLLNLIVCLHESNICISNSDVQFIELAQQKKGKFLSCSGELVASSFRLHNQLYG